jgi:hypothetical protein
MVDRRQALGLPQRRAQSIDIVAHLDDRRETLERLVVDTLELGDIR